MFSIVTILRRRENTSGKTLHSRENAGDSRADASSKLKKRAEDAAFPCIFRRIMLYYLVLHVFNPETIKDSA
jgi:hypothetical protein